MFETISNLNKKNMVLIFPSVENPYGSVVTNDSEIRHCTKKEVT